MRNWKSEKQAIFLNREVMDHTCSKVISGSLTVIAWNNSEFHICQSHSNFVCRSPLYTQQANKDTKFVTRSLKSFHCYVWRRLRDFLLDNEGNLHCREWHYLMIRWKQGNVVFPHRVKAFFSMLLHTIHSLNYNHLGKPMLTLKDN